MAATRPAKRRDPAAGLLPPSRRQLGYLRSLAVRAGVEFIPPRTRSHASQEIERLKKRL